MSIIYNQFVIMMGNAEGFHPSFKALFRTQSKP